MSQDESLKSKLMDEFINAINNINFKCIYSNNKEREIGYLKYNAPES